MTLFEYLSVAFSIVLSLATVRLLSGLSVAFLRERRYWPHALWIVLSLLTGALVWWNFWSFRDVDWNLLSFLAVLTVPSTMYLLAAALVPEQPGRVLSWHDHFFAARKRVFAALGGFFLLVMMITLFVVDLPLVHTIRLPQVSALLIAIIGIASSNNVLHRALPLAFLTLLVAAGVLLFLRPNSLSIASVDTPIQYLPASPAAVESQ